MKISEETKHYIDTIEKQLKDMDCLEPTDEENLRFLGEQVELYHRAMEELETTGLTVVDQRGRTVANPCFSIARSCMTQIVAIWKELSVSHRQRRLLLNQDIGTETSPLDVFAQDIKDLI